MSEAFIGEVRYLGFQFPPEGWALCDGAQLPIAEHDALFNLIGNRYGGDGTSTFAVPDLRGSVALGQGTGPDLPARALTSKTSIQSAADPQSPDRAIGTLVLNPCICLYGIYPSPY